MLIVRDLFRGLTRYGEFQQSPEGIPTNILASRLAKLQAAGIIASAPYQQNPPRYAYTLTARGRDLKPVLGALALWSMRNLPKTKPDAELAAALRD
jgi:DNA-binding HxlR family transcriptional regulator